MAHHDNIIVGSAIVGANVGAYVTTKTNDGYMFGVIVGGLGGGLSGALSPIIFPGLIFGGPGYIVSKLHSSLRESRQREERLKDLKDLVSEKKGEPRV